MSKEQDLRMLLTNTHNMKKTIFIFLMIAIMLFPLISADENSSLMTQIKSTIINESDFSALSLSINTTNMTPEKSPNVALPKKENITLLLIKNIIPQEFKLGDIQMTLQIENAGTETQKNILALVTAKGFSTYDVLPIDSLNPEEKGYLLITGNFKESGTILLTIKIQSFIFYKNITVIAPSNISNLEKENSEKLKIQLIQNITSELKAIKQKYLDLESKLNEKKNEDYDVSDISLNQIKIDLRETETNIISGEVQKAQASVILAKEELEDQEKKIESVKKASSITKIKEYAIIFSTIAGALLTFFALSEHLKKRSQAIVKHVKGPPLEQK